MANLNSTRRNFLLGSASTASLLGAGLGLSAGWSGKVSAKVLPNPDPKAIVKLNAGKIRGAISDGVHIYRGIPYGDTTGGKNRFLPPQPVKPWTEIKDTLEFGNTAPQGGGIGSLTGKPSPDARVTSALFAPLSAQPQSEDCLFLNVWSKGVGKKSNRPVMVWLHGGGFTSGSGASSLYDGINLCRRGDVVVVTINHRLGALAHLNLAKAGGEKYKNSGMAGMLDIVQALEWVRDNISQFGGNPKNVTIFGESGGGRKVSTILATPAAKNLFHRAVIQSGPGLRFPSADIAALRTEILMEELGLKPNQVDELLAMPFEKIIQVQATAERKLVQRLPEDAPFFDRYGWSPVECEALPHAPFDPNAPDESFAVPVIIGTNRHEMALFISPNKALDVVDEKTLMAQAVSIVGSDKADDLIAVYKKQYPEENLRGILLLMLADDRYRMDSIKLAERKKAKGGAPIYMYRFDWETPAWNGLLRASHALEIPFVFDNAQLCHAFTGGGLDAVQLAAVMSETWLSFARDGNPNNNMLPKWNPYDEKQRSTMLFSDTPQLANDPGAEERLAWSKIR